MPKIKKTMAVQPMTLLNRPVYTGPGTNFFPPQTKRQNIGVPHATLFAATARENSAAAAAGAMRQSRPRIRATKTQPQTARMGIRRRECTWLKKPEKGRAPSREKALYGVSDHVAGSMKIDGKTYPALSANSNQHTQAHEELNNEQ
jgi:N-acetylneuraminic acid mutarotase